MKRTIAGAAALLVLLAGCGSSEPTDQASAQACARLAMSYSELTNALTEQVSDPTGSTDDRRKVVEGFPDELRAAQRLSVGGSLEGPLSDLSDIAFLLENDTADSSVKLAFMSVESRLETCKKAGFDVGDALDTH